MKPERALHYCWQYEPSVPHPVHKNVRYRGWFLVAVINNPKQTEADEAVVWAKRQPELRAVTYCLTPTAIKPTLRALNKIYRDPTKIPCPTQVNRA